MRSQQLHNGGKRLGVWSERGEEIRKESVEANNRVYSKRENVFKMEIRRGERLENEKESYEAYWWTLGQDLLGSSITTDNLIITFQVSIYSN